MFLSVYSAASVMNSPKWEQMNELSLWERSCKMFKLDIQQPTTEAKFRFRGLKSTLN